MSEPTGLAWVALSFAKLLAIFVVYLGTVAYTTLAERRISAWIQDRHGPNRVGPQGLFQPVPARRATDSRSPGSSPPSAGS